MFNFLELRHEVSCQFGPDFGVALLGLEDQLLQALVLFAGIGLE
jgi:hypothetical protein